MEMNTMQDQGFAMPTVEEPQHSRRTPLAEPQLSPRASSGRAWSPWLTRHPPRGSAGHWELAAEGEMPADITMLTARVKGTVRLCIYTTNLNPNPNPNPNSNPNPDSNPNSNPNPNPNPNQVRVLGEFSKLREAEYSRSDYMQLLTSDLCSCYGMPHP
eukprot:scaffold17617_cov39-Phaeocystis_antarctica.AAC.1